MKVSAKNYLEYWITAEVSPATFNDAELMTREISGSICICGRTPFSWRKGYDDFVCRNLFIRSNGK